LHTARGNRIIGNKEKLFTRTIEIKAYFSQIEGLKVGAPVRLSGYDIGSVSGIAFAQNDSTAKIESFISTPPCRLFINYNKIVNRRPTFHNYSFLIMHY